MPTIKFLRDILKFGDASLENYACSKMFSLKVNSILVSRLADISKLTVQFALLNRI